MNRILRRLRPALLCFVLARAVAAAEDTAAIVRSLQPFQQQVDARAVDLAWPHLDAPQAAVREAARRVLIAQPLAQWKDRALEEKATWASLEALRALAEACPLKDAPALSPYLCEHLTTLRLEAMDDAQLTAALGLTRLIFTRLGPVTDDERQQMLDLWSHLQPSLPAGPQAGAKDLLDFLARAPIRRP